jgi:hypothetical protein
MQHDEQSDRLRALVGDLARALPVADPEKIVQLLSDNVSSCRRLLFDCQAFVMSGPAGHFAKHCQRHRYDQQAKA